MTRLVSRTRCPRGGLRAAAALVVALLAFDFTGAAAQTADTRAETGTPSPTSPTAEPPEPGALGTGAESLLQLERRTEEDRRRLREAEEDLVQAARELEAASKRFDTLDEELAALRAAAEDPTVMPEGLDAARLAERVESVERARKQARDLLDLAIRRRQALERQTHILRQEVSLEEELVPVLRGETSVEAPVKDAGVAPEARPAPATAPATAQGETPQERAALETGAPVYDRRAARALRHLERSQEELARLASRTRLLDRTIGLNEADLAATRELLELARETRERSAGMHRSLQEELEASRSSRGAAPERLQELRRRAESARERAADAEEEIEQRASRIDMLEALLTDLRERLVSMDRRTAEAEDAVDAAQRRAEFVQSPWAPHRILRRVISAAPWIAIVLGLLGLFWLTAHLVVRRFARSYVKRGRRGTPEERRERADTLHRASNSLLNVVFLGFGALVVLDQLGVDVTVLLGGAAIFGVALAFGAQNLIQDYYFGFMILLENQYRVGNVVQIGDVSGVVEDITLRMTMLRDLEGIAHFIPHSHVTMVSNMTHQWSRAMLDLGVAYKEDVDRVIGVLGEVARELRKDGTYAPMILEDAEILGVDQLADSAVVIRMTVKTVPVKQWAVKRELLRRIKNRFDELGIEIPFPHRSVYVRSSDPEQPEGDADAPSTSAQRGRESGDPS